MMEPIDAHDGRERRCPILGHDVHFSYCRHPGQELPCRKVLDCWWEAFGVEAFLRSHFTGEQIAGILAPPKPKVATLVDLIDQARKRTEAP
jgi:hypothetical protein